jgi:sugar phosphate permease
MATFFWVLTIIGSVIGGLLILFTLLSAKGAPQEAAGAAVGLSFAIIPYCIARALSEMARPTRESVRTAARKLSASGGWQCAACGYNAPGGLHCPDCGAQRPAY